MADPMLFDLICYEVWWGKLYKCDLFFIFFQVCPCKWWHSESALSCEEIDALFDQIGKNFDKQEKHFNYLFIFTDDFFKISMNHFDDFDDFFIIFDDLMP